MQRFILKIVCFLCCLLLQGAFDDAQAAKSSIQHVSKRIKITRPDSPEQQVAPTPEQKTEKPAEKSSVAKTDEKSRPDERPVQTSENEPQKAASDQAKKAESEKIKKEAVSLLGERERLYARKGKLDPFAPFVHSPKPESGDTTQKKLQRRKPRTPLERVSLGQLRLTAVMETPDQNLAMVEEASGKGYVVKKGTYIGDQGGRIIEVLSDAIVIEEKYLDVLGNVATREKKLKLQK